MGKSTNFSGQPVLSQLIKLMDRQKINTLASKSGANYYTKHLDGYSHLVVMLYAVLSNLRSLREVCLGFAAHATRMNHLGIDHMIVAARCPMPTSGASLASSAPSTARSTSTMLKFYRTASRKRSVP